MAIITLDFNSKELKMNTLVTVIAPDSARIGQTPLALRQCLYLLHGLSDDATSCVRLSQVELYATEADIVVVMPSVGRSLYCDDINGQNYFSYVANELPEYLGLVMGLSRKKEDNYIAGISMGGMGAARIALTYPERFTAVGLFSGLLDLKLMIPQLNDMHRREFPFLLAAMDEIDTTPLSPVNLLNAEKQSGLNIIVRCGQQDNLYPLSLSFYDKAKKMGLRVSGIFGNGDHEWRTWDKYIADFIKMMAMGDNG